MKDWCWVIKPKPGYIKSRKKQGEVIWELKANPEYEIPYINFNAKPCVVQ